MDKIDGTIANITKNRSILCEKILTEFEKKFDAKFNSFMTKNGYISVEACKKTVADLVKELKEEYCEK